MTREHVFVYGTLRRGAGHPMHETLARMSQFVGLAHYQGVLYDLGPYPGAVRDPRGRSTVWGELYAVLPGQPLLSMLDRYEGCTSLDPKPHVFLRDRVTVTRDDGTVEQAWIYLYAGALTRARHIPGGDYLRRASRDRSPT
ncbi:MAG: gamma-glutamylcyclotransferase [Candidatus Lambdaproteobacteria bacterium]|nr:gamma-glutamylcyclotransferase [Candidatus Lambdaproteobacteria bacterium]